MTEFDTNKTVLEGELEAIIAELNTIATQNTKTGDWVAIPDPEMADDADQNVAADNVEEWNERRALMAQLEIRYRNITIALQKISDNTYGTCEIGGEAIEAERLEANPAARTCMAHIDREKELTL